MINSSLKPLFVFALLLFVSACQSPQKVKPEITSDTWLSGSEIFKQSYAKQASLNQWEYRAKVGVVNHQEKSQANMVWSFSQPDQNTIRLFGPFGIGAIRIDFDDKEVVLSDHSGELRRGTNAQELLQSIVGWSIPVDALQYWLFSLPLPNKQYVYKLGADSEVAVMQQLGWTINYSDYRDYLDQDFLLARKVIASKQVAPGKLVTVTLITRSWK